AGTARRPRRRVMATAGACVAALVAVAGLLVFRPDSSPLPVLGDPRTADPCALTDAGAVSRFGNGTTTYESAYGNFNRCDVIVTLGGGSRVLVTVELDKPGPPEGTSEKVGALRVFREPRNGNRCNRTVVLADQNRVSITAELRPGREPRSADLCAMADAATGHVVAVLGRGAIPRRAAPADAASLARMDACPLLDSTAVTRVLGADASAAEAGFGDWECRWSSDTSKLSVLLAFDRNDPLNSSDGRHLKFGGHDVYIAPEADEADCLAQVVYRSGFDANGEPADELLKIVVRGPQTPDQLCGPATELAAAAAAKLPLPR
ncbi:MAG: hypothetical protein ACRDRP_25115, partial [Pseudonocardiaceae bacterium]